ncbi:chromatin-remodeling ATPase INO80 [Osmia lignaria lignaria]|uniref:chromatin-remodeling ATPase INO80 n=1 Tax=Osmia lignaria lignaria TaxID=1437193 RepID=UPI001478B6A3|nr:chromatin-remodeling ATPase INO80 [Osmia lignaria]XP_034175000.1 chromatin-remodeling ATPase INO80 [Osmia lignaria]XP_034175001.1 chromatin-remodeling ATPase INO80 [Osmia lignaria]XP_034175002.1 chromatin-remodeling ATPase INO80 [Osmia lignaria]XP_034175003.1 chromatin-remodeling ATPase INO80 [Osmia lignaria]XP_034175004.1 chromatin-remodeling ATPase INO80 [Osmia lignaria]XP_034175005.1 chromatin-remodeling ATPase INO80 [Osmia lignaria]XP_034175006.1 chromatin-remodeling ATPase INO80 [Osm
MTDRAHTMRLEAEMAAPLHLQRLERSLNVQPFLRQINELFQDPASEDDKSISSESSEGSDNYLDNVLIRKEEERINKLRVYNMSNVGEERRWLQDILLSDSSDSSASGSDTDSPITEEDFQEMLKFHILRKKYQARFYQKPENIQYQYYSAGLLSSYDRFLEHQKLIVGNKKKKEKKPEKKVIKIKKEKLPRHRPSEDYLEGEYPEEEWDRTIPKEEELDEAELEAIMRHQPRQRGRKKHNNKSPEVMAMRRRKIWVMMSKKELGKVQRAKTNNHKEMLISCKKVAQHCMRHWRQKAMQSQRNMKETIWKAKRLTREMQAYWKRYDRVERETRRRLEKEAEEQRKMDVELIEAKRQQRKLNFLITQTELYAHFMSRKLGKASPEEQLRILNQLDEEKNPRLVGIDDYDSEIMKQKAKRNATEAFDNEKARAKQFDTAAASQELRLSDTPETLEHPQPSIFKGNLKGYQLKGMNWLANLYDQGISGILADEMGLGKTVQSIAFLCHVAERYSVWGPFLIISPASTLHNWQQEMARFVPMFKVVPYWGNPQERKILRQFWDTKDLHTKEASFHVVITSYQLVITDYKYFNRIKWQYMILDEAQAIKSTSSMRWKLLLGFSCRNRLLLSGTPIQNSMAELWALLHFIMPTLFDSHDEFNEWFSKDIESHAENKTGIDEKHLSRLHMILKPFMLRRIKKDVENELSDKIEVMVYCPLTTRQKLLYSALKKKIRIEDLLHYTVGGDTASNDKNFTSNLMNLVMQFRKVCNHPELFERRDAKSPLFMRTEFYEMPALLYTEGLVHLSLPSKDHLLYNKLFIFATEHVHRTLYGGSEDLSQNPFSFSRFINLSPMELNKIFIIGILFRLCLATIMERKIKMMHYWEDWNADERTAIPRNQIFLVPKRINTSSRSMQDLLFTKKIMEGESVYTHTTHVIHSMPETVAHRILRSSKKTANQLLKRILPSTKTEQEDTKVTLLPEHPHLPRPPIMRYCQQTTIPSFICDTYPKVQASPRKLYVSNSSAACAWRRHEECGGKFGQRLLWLGCEQALSDPLSQESLASQVVQTVSTFSVEPHGGISACTPINGWSNIIVPDKQTLVTDAGKLSVLDSLLRRLKEQGHRVLIYSQMTKMIDLLEEYMYHRKHTFMRLDGSSKISDRRDMVADFQKRADIFVFLLSTRAGGLGINLTAADTVIFYDSDWNPTVDQQAMDRAHRLGQTKQVTVYRLICKGTIEERILQRAREKSEIQRMVISGGNFKPDTLKPKEVVSLLLDDEEIEAKYSQRSEERKQHAEDARVDFNLYHKERDRKRKLTALPVKGDAKKPCLSDANGDKIGETYQSNSNESSQTGGVQSYHLNNHQQIIDSTDDYSVPTSPAKSEDETSNDGLVVDVDGPVGGTSSDARQSRISQYGEAGKVSRLEHHMPFSSGTGVRMRPNVRGTSKRGRPRGSRRGGPVGGKGRGLLLLHPSKGLGSEPQSPSSLSPTSSSIANEQTLQHGIQGISGAAEGEGPSTVGPMGAVSSRGGAPAIRRGPGRPRLRPTGPGHQGYRTPGHHQGRKVQRPLPVPLRSQQTIATVNQQKSSSVQRPSGSGATISSSALNASSSFTSSTSESRPFGFYTQQQQQQPRGSS